MLMDPSVYWACMPAIRSVKRLTGRLRLLASRTPRDRFLDVDRLLWVPPRLIEFKSLLKGSVLRHSGCGWVVGGDWDRLEHPFARDVRFRSVRSVIEGSASWQATEEYTSAALAIEQGETVHHCRTREELDERYRLLDSLIEDIRRDGYLTQSELRRRRTAAGTLGRCDEVTVAIGRDGELLFRDGAHRLAMAILLDVDRIPVQVAMRHESWMAFRRKIETYTNDHGGTTPQPLLHPDLDHIPCTEVCAGRYELVVRSLTPSGGRVLDFTPGWGYFCQRLTVDGFRCCALESTDEAVGFIHTLSRAAKRSFATAAAASLETIHRSEGGFDIGLMLSDGLQAVQRPSTDTLLSFLSAAAPRELLVEPEAFVAHGDRRWQQDRDRQASGTFLRAAMESGGYTDSEHLGHTREAGDLYRLTQAGSNTSRKNL